MADLRVAHVAPLVATLSSAYYLDKSRALAAVTSRRSFNAIHLASMVKIDVFVTRGRPFDEEALLRARPAPFSEAPDGPVIVVASPEDTILAKLEWFRAGGEVSERQWSDVVGVLEVKGPGIDRAYLERWAASLGVADLLERALAEVEPR